MFSKSNHKVENFSKELETKKKNQMKIQEQKNNKTEINLHETTSSRLGEVKAGRGGSLSYTEKPTQRVRENEEQRNMKFKTLPTCFMRSAKYDTNA